MSAKCEESFLGEPKRDGHKTSLGNRAKGQRVAAAEAPADTEALQKATVLNWAWRDANWEKWHALLMRIWD